MSATLVSSNTTIKVNGAVSGTTTQSNGNTGTVYTAPANGYAIIQVYVSGTIGAGTITIGGRNVYVFNSTTGPTATSTLAPSPLVFYVGPSQAVQFSNTAGSPGTCVASGVEFINTP